MKSKQFCSVCKEWLEMEVVPTGDGDDDGVIWYRCPQCQGFLPKLSSSESSDESESDTESPAEDSSPASAPESSGLDPDDEMPFDSPAEMMAAQSAAKPDRGSDSSSEDDSPREKSTDDSASTKSSSPAPEVEPIAEYAVQLEEALSILPPDAEGGLPYRPWDTYEVGQCIHHLAWEDCGVVVGKEELPGGRQIIKVFFQEAGVVRLIEQAAK